MFKANFNDVAFPSKIAERFAQDREAELDRVKNNLRAAGLKESFVKEKAEQTIPFKEWNPVERSCEVIETAIQHYFRKEYWDEKRNTTVAPWDIRKMAGKISGRLMDCDNGEMELSDEQLDFLLKVFQSDLPTNSLYVYLGEYFEELKLKKEK